MFCSTFGELFTVLLGIFFLLVFEYGNSLEVLVENAPVEFDSRRLCDFSGPLDGRFLYLLWSGNNALTIHDFIGLYNGLFLARYFGGGCHIFSTPE